jgi:hypothetical protein
MVFLDAGHLETPAALDPYRNEALGLVISALLPLAAVFAMAGLVAFLGLGRAAPLYSDPMKAALFAALFPMWGVAHWLAAREGEAGHRAAAWVLALIGGGLIYPFLPIVLDPFLTGWANIVAVLVIAATAIRLARVSQAAMLLVLPSLAWVALAAIPGYVLLTNGWSPGFAVTVAALNESDPAEA